MSWPRSFAKSVFCLNTAQTLVAFVPELILLKTFGHVKSFSLSSRSLGFLLGKRSQKILPFAPPLQFFLFLGQIFLTFYVLSLPIILIVNNKMPLFLVVVELSSPSTFCLCLGENPGTKVSQRFGEVFLLQQLIW